MSKAEVHTSLVDDAHAYTRSKTPWILDERCSIYGKLIHYLSGGGMSTFGRTVRQEEARMRQVRFLLAMAVFIALWFLFLVF